MMKYKTEILFVIFTLVPFLQMAQTPKDGTTYKDVYFGIGAGLDYGGFGAKIELLPGKQMGFFLGGGYNLIGLSYNAGTSIKLLPKNRQSPALLAMYGYNAVVDYYNLFKTYYGFSIGLGYEYEVGKNNNKFSTALILPFRSSSFKEDIRNIPVANRTKISDVLFSLGFNIAGSTKKKKKN